MTTAITNATSHAAEILEPPVAAGGGAQFLSILDEAAESDTPQGSDTAARLSAAAGIARARTAAAVAASDTSSDPAPVTDPDEVSAPVDDPVDAPDPVEPSTTFVRTADARSPHLPRFSQVPDAVKYPLGPYRQAPEELGGDWWYVNPFTGAEPWTKLDASTWALTEEAPVASAEFLSVFGPRPTSATSSNPRVDVIEWDQNLEHFQGVGVPEGYTQEQVDAANSLYEAWGMGPAMFYEGRYGWQARFANGFEASPYAAIEVPHLIVAQYQVEMTLVEGAEPEVRHPFVPPGVWPDGGSASSEPEIS